MAMIKCKECGAEISSSAQKCPSCGKDQRNFFMKHKILSVILILVVLSAIGSALGGGGDDKKTASADKPAATDSQDSKAEEKPENLPKVGDLLTTDDYEIVITSVEEASRVGSQYLNKEPATGGVFVVVNYTVKNITDKPIGAFSTPTFSLLDSNGTSYDADIDASSYYATEKKLNDKIFSDLNPGITVQGADVYEISKELYEAGGWKVHINADDELDVQAN